MAAIVNRVKKYFLREDKNVYIPRTFACENFFPDEPIHWRYFISLRGVDNLLVWSWILKDLSWNSNWWIPSWIFGSSSVFLALIMLLRVWSCPTGVLHHFTQLLWLFGNYWWLIGEEQDYHDFGDTGDNYDRHTEVSKWILTSAICIEGIHYLILRPLDVFEGRLTKDSENPIITNYNEVGFKPRFRFYFRHWREYENFHLVCWIGKDLSWMALIPGLWAFFTALTLLVALDFVWKSICRRGKIVEHLNYWVYLWWLVGNFFWAMGDEFYEDFATEDMFLGRKPPNYRTFRFWGGWTFILALIYLAFTYVYWIICTLTGNILTKDDKYSDGNKTKAQDMHNEL
eukprot:TRINITY_DN9496_c0_g1_i1.p1 TRINITY_DN9496_c0_g1~~TRINITY_DN9496_c0_g1_i1.p1  ORF type:complete len:343 (-),score=49.31 TRINITY_DN9496_c0_g1_i1:81-1109(-)